ncbi:hypothetical protein HanIR_Chr11g0505241 [Helianthus annuus]|nr:hypothetical protein HanIR_Chr11g0505241 [Helianthus annuus]
MVSFLVCVKACTFFFLSGVYRLSCWYASKPVQISVYHKYKSIMIQFGLHLFEAIFK